MTNPTPLHIEHPLDMDDARRASRRLAELRRSAEDDLKAAVEYAAATERDYRKALAEAHIRRADHEGTAASREAQARSDAADAAYARDLADGLVKVARERLTGLEGERAQLRALMEWSQRMEDREAPSGRTFGAVA